MHHEKATSHLFHVNTVVRHEFMMISQNSYRDMVYIAKYINLSVPHRLPNFEILAMWVTHK